MSGSPTSVLRTGPYPEAADYSKTLLDCLRLDEFKIGSVSRVQLLLACLVERLHDAIYVLPRHARDPVGAAPEADEYAKDLFAAISSLKIFAQKLPEGIDMQELDRLNGRISVLKEQNREILQRVKEAETRVFSALSSHQLQ